MVCFVDQIGRIAIKNLLKTLTAVDPATGNEVPDEGSFVRYHIMYVDFWKLTKPRSSIEIIWVQVHGMAGTRFF